MVAQPEERLVDVDEYVAHEQTSMVKHEYVHGRGDDRPRYRS